MIFIVNVIWINWLILMGHLLKVYMIREWVMLTLLILDFIFFIVTVSFNQVILNKKCILGCCHAPMHFHLGALHLKRFGSPGLSLACKTITWQWRWCHECSKSSCTENVKVDDSRQTKGSQTLRDGRILEGYHICTCQQQMHKSHVVHREAKINWV